MTRGVVLPLVALVVVFALTAVLVNLVPGREAIERVTSVQTRNDQATLSGTIAPGRVVGATDPEGRERMPADPVDVGDLTATVLAALGIDSARELATPAGRPMRLSGGRVVERLMADGIRPQA